MIKYILFCICFPLANHLAYSELYSYEKKRIKIGEVVIEYSLNNGLLEDTVRYFLSKEEVLKQCWKEGKLSFEDKINLNSIEYFEQIQLEFYQQILFVNRTPFIEGEVSLVKIRNIEGFSEFIVVGGLVEKVEEGLKITPKRSSGSLIQLFGFYTPLNVKVLILEEIIQ